MNRSIPFKYAFALFDPKDEPNKVYEDFLNLKQVIKQQSIIKSIMCFYNFNSRLAVKVIKNLPYSDSFKSFLTTLFRNHRLNIFDAIFKEFEKLVFKDVKRKTIVSATELEKKQKEEIESIFKNTIIDYQTNKNLIGGFIVKDENFVIDLSLLGFYKEFKNKIFSKD